MKKLGSLTEYNKKFISYTDMELPQLNGIGCPKCGSELLDSKPYLILTSIPPQKNVHCSECDFVGYRNA